jgi:probable O-glycosylation ligase (exosortase A-associated)
VLVLTLSIGFFGLKGGIWALMMGGTQRVEGPEGSFIGGNNGLALGLDMALPLLFFLAREESNPWLRRLLWAVFVFSIPATIFTYSRGGFLGLMTVLAFIAMKTKRQMIPGVVFVTLVVAVLSFAPQQWFDRTETIVSYEGDGSAMGRLVAWEVAFRFALDHPLLGGGFSATAHESVYLQYLGIRASQAPHSIWFSTLSEHGFPGLILFVSLLVCCLATLRKLRRPRGGLPPAAWVVSYSHMLEVSLVGYIVAGTFLSVAYIDVFYWVVALVILLDVVAARERRDAASATLSPAPAAVPSLKSSGGRHVRYRRVR